MLSHRRGCGEWSHNLTTLVIFAHSVRILSLPPYSDRHCGENICCSLKTADTFPIRGDWELGLLQRKPSGFNVATYIPDTPPRMPSDGLASIEWGWDLGPSNGEDLYPLSFFLSKWGGHTLPKTIGVPNCPLHVGHRLREVILGPSGQLGWLAICGRALPIKGTK